ncbi:hypothetical protein AAA799E16_00739 [Marine Group I thaumarchaeote SCGC AAA799-E16]|uniref:Uncharacterized protein n=4 Tax=Marine Group I TaxID=905826 RepID=A0A087S9A2_9ARCH|nr:hypothetical protein AAA799N04_01870 [Marine Group I thaumarchaeote SCGC AAA799-N04]KER06501.1 hypothetical protein AAA799E16_00739 [Marine Group I thaumarchaeote SCGC AAA799-E16]KFM18433.1 hypothetical protein SCCGRSA3_01119 [Marine Group I thaumarchaeote SCGC RSA3]KFM22306.1 hypothetical protein AAA799B03_00056 [Marine Group I thaumarchaeote SCGC AAA799-B03]
MSFFLVLQKQLLQNYVVFTGFFLLSLIFIVPVYAMTELERVSLSDPGLENAFGAPIVENVNVYHQIQISADIQNNQKKSQTVVYLVQVKDDKGFVVSLGWISGQLTSLQKLTPSLSWVPEREGEFFAEIYVWEGLKNQNALDDFSTIQIHVS